jgi:ribonuclease M5
VGETAAQNNQTITKLNMAELGLSGGRESKQRRAWLLKRLDLPEHMSSNALLQALNLLCSLQELTDIMKEIPHD